MAKVDQFNKWLKDNSIKKPFEVHKMTIKSQLLKYEKGNLFLYRQYYNISLN